MTIETLFGKEEIPAKSRSIKFRVIKPVFETLIVREEITNYLKPGNRYTSPEQVFETFRFLQHETKEYFFSLSLDGKNRMVRWYEINGHFTKSGLVPLRYLHLTQI